jgi:hypothetical protein
MKTAGIAGRFSDQARTAYLTVKVWLPALAPFRKISTL